MDEYALFRRNSENRLRGQRAHFGNYYLFRCTPLPPDLLESVGYGHTTIKIFEE